MNPAGNPGKNQQGWLKSQVNQFTPAELAKKKPANFLRAALGHWFDFFKFAITFLAVFLFVQVILLGAEVLFTDISGIKVIAPLEALPEEPTEVQAAESDSMQEEMLDEEVTEEETVSEEEMATEDSLALAEPEEEEPVKAETEQAVGLLSEQQIRQYFGVATDEYPDFISFDQFKLVLIINTIIALLASIFVFYYHFFFLISEDGQTFGLRSSRVEIIRKDGRELASQGGIGGTGKGPALIYTLFYLLFLPVFTIVTILQIRYAFLWSFIEGFRSLDSAIAGSAITMNILAMLGYWILAIVILVGVAFIFGLIFHVVWLVASTIASALGKDEPESMIAI